MNKLEQKEQTNNTLKVYTSETAKAAFADINPLWHSDPCLNCTFENQDCVYCHVCPYDS